MNKETPGLDPKRYILIPAQRPPKGEIVEGVYCIYDLTTHGILIIENDERALSFIAALIRAGCVTVSRERFAEFHKPITQLIENDVFGRLPKAVRESVLKHIPNPFYQ